MEFKQYINGELVRGKGPIRDVYDPGTDEVIASLAGASKEQTEAALAAAQAAFPKWSRMSLTERGQWIEKLRSALLEHREEIVDLLVREAGKPGFAAGRGFNVLCDALHFYFEEARRVYGRVTPDYNSDYNTWHITQYRPLGVVVGHLAWNMPLLNLGAKLGPALASGCTCVLKPASFTPLSALRVGEIAQEIGFPAGVINIVSGTVADVAETLNASSIPKLITLIGSTETGLNCVRASATTVKGHSLELGGNAPAIVTESADLEAAANFIAGLKMNNCGQLCTSVNRALVHASVAERFCVLIQEKFEACRLGCHDEDCDMGPLISDEERQRVLGLIDSAVKDGAKLICGGQIPERKGYYLTPALLTGCNNRMEVCRKEIFGPVLPVLTYSTLDEAIAIANDTDYGLSAYAYTSNLKDAFRLYQELEVGEVFVNVWGGGSPLPYPHAGAKSSGIGADFSTDSLMEYLRIKRVCMTP